MLKFVRNQAGFSMVEIILAMGGLVAIGGGYMFLNSQQGKHLKAMNDSMNASTIGAVIQDLMKDPNSCVASVHDAFPSTPPAITGPVELTRVVKASKAGSGWTTQTYYEKGKTYSHLKLLKITIRPYSASEDQTQNPKLVLTFGTETNGTITKKYEFFSNTVAQAMYPTYNFGCSGKPMMSGLGNLLTVNAGAIPCAASGSVYTMNVMCPGGTKPVSCGIKDLNKTGDEDVVTCYLDVSGQQCVFNHERSDSCDTISGECYCL